jgi:antitoxin HigA-1
MVMCSTLIYWTTTRKGVTQMPMKTPPHPGRSIVDACLDPLGLNVDRGCHGQAGISAEMAIRLEKAGWSNADHYLHL